jgi:hypothetical protein
MDKRIGLETQPGKWEPGRPPASRTILQKITDDLEAAGITISGIETWPPEEDGRISVSLVIRPRPEPALSVEYADLDAFIETYLVYDDSCCESVKTVYEKYTNYKRSSVPVNKLGEFCFIRGIIGYFAIKYKKVDFFSTAGIKGEIDYCFSNVRLVRYIMGGPDEKTAAPDAVNANKAPDAPPAVRDPRGECSGLACDTRPAENSTPIKPYTPEEAVDAMRKGRILRNKKGDKFYWQSVPGNPPGFYQEDKQWGKLFICDFSGLYEEARYA